ncbi:MAG: Nif3-like dinuclear metal center hexameric protein [Flavobacteriales bacterium]|jgi:dinuclear metal center YbgI/SA1388 family protein|nr:Nif3-like dinuclear metal center hexameric protein [Flavobacteriales bacterium]MBT3964774.1 Nif3-like dinuclear metal center hexameric protein [Flavobacteriales bacterium]MBT4704916.1 Nif3-like dinuclear metal center hexameric protein [Flavobacteriales bacterium]MBT4929691.1 Nif3-like dinuclear metal center hexameric protein [Flavobacteriales bacterium]MBT5132867.1 Nif3-like dinuclear metal center hexameric protein [Flavobacteriales bacterium]
MTVGDIISELEKWAPRALQESYDNSGLLTGSSTQDVTTVLCSLDCTEAVIDEAIHRNCEMVISHHPIIFSGLKNFSSDDYVTRTVLKAIKNDIAIYAIHTNLDNVHDGVNAEIGKRLGLENLKILSPKKGILRKLVTFIPTKHSSEVKQAIYEAGGGSIGDYDHCSFSVTGTGSFRGGENTNPHSGEKGVDHMESEDRVEIIYSKPLESNILGALIESHPYEEVAYDIYPLENMNPQIGSGQIGTLQVPMEEKEFMSLVADRMNSPIIKHTSLLNKKVSRVAVCGGSGGFLLSKAIDARADVFVTADFKYHDYFDAEEKTVILDIGHYESEQFTPHLIQDFLQEIFPTFAVLLSGVKTNPVNYFIS